MKQDTIPATNPPSMGTLQRSTLARRGKIPQQDSTKSAAITRRELAERDPARKILKYFAWLGIIPGLIASGIIVYLGVQSIPKYKYCLVLEDNFDGDSINRDIWTHELSLGGFGNNEFEWSTNSPENSYVRDGKLHILPTLTSDFIPLSDILSGYLVNLTSQGCQGGDDRCFRLSNIANGTIIPPVRSARLTTKGKMSIKYGKGEVRVKMPRGDWLWPAVWMLPEENTYGPWPASGELDIIESRGNDPSYPEGGLDKMLSAMHYGVSTSNRKIEFRKIKRRHGTLASTFHTIGWEWTPEYFLTWLDSPLRTNLYVPFDKYMINKDGGFGNFDEKGNPIVDPWTQTGRFSTPFDQNFFLILNVAVGGTNGFFPDGQGKKPWVNSDPEAIIKFLQALPSWYNTTWPSNAEDRAMQVDYVKVWKLCDKQ
ncbi:hypothetical protein HDV05_008440 [Chytridiales sp. JEL 0842]|nr:hypothetical protein HDV05_008440 [Chytridiales sp. JEL 0842]